MSATSNEPGTMDSARKASSPSSVTIYPSETSSDNPALKNLHNFIEDLTAATDVILRSGKQYSHVKALVACWPDELSDRPHIRKSAKRLCSVLREKYRFDVSEKPYEMDKQAAHLKFVKELVSCMEIPADFTLPQRSTDPSRLFILYYGGHAVERSGKMEWCPSESAESQASVVWPSVLDLFRGFRWRHPLHLRLLLRRQNG